LKHGLAETEGTCLTLTWQTIKVLFPQAGHRLQVPFYRTKVTSWMASQEEDYRFILLEADPADDRSWAQLCVEQADCILLVVAQNAEPGVTAAEYETVWRLLMPPVEDPSPRSSNVSHHGPPASAETQSKMSTLDAATSAGTDASRGACFTADSSDNEVCLPVSRHLSLLRVVHRRILMECVFLSSA
jgi:hypothetical protein